MRNLRRIMTAALAVITLSLLGATQAEAAPSTSDLLSRHAGSMRELDDQIAAQLAVAPGGERTAANEVSYAGGEFVVTYAMPGKAARGSADCPYGWFCFYDGVNFGYPRGKLSDCDWQDLNDFGWVDRIESVHNNSDWDVSYLQHEDYGDPGNGHEYDYTEFYNDAKSADAWVSPRNSVDHVYQWGPC